MSVWLLSLLVACQCDTPARTRLPSHVSVVVWLESATEQEEPYASLIVDLNAPRRRPTVRAHQGILAFDGDRLVEVSRVPRAGTEGRVQDLRLQHPLEDTSILVRIAPDDVTSCHLEIAQVREQRVVVRAWGDSWERWVEVDSNDGDLEDVDAVVASARFIQMGPGQGFSIQSEGGHLLLKLPHDREQDSIQLVDGVASVVSVDWVSVDAGDPVLQGVLDHRFKMAGALTALARSCEVDGDLREWSRDMALAVDSLAQVQRGEEGWHGARDASFGVTARVTPTALCAAVRVRDDDIIPGGDRIEFEVAGQVLSYDAPLYPEERQDEWARAAFNNRITFGLGMEACFDRSAWQDHPDIVPFRVLFNDIDTDSDVVTVLATAPDLPWPSLAGVLLPRGLPEPVVSGEGSRTQP